MAHPYYVVPCKHKNLKKEALYMKDPQNTLLGFKKTRLLKKIIENFHSIQIIYYDIILVHI